MNIQELQTIVTQNLPIKIFVWNNGGYGTIRGHQKSIFKGRFVGVDAASGTAFPDLEKISKAYDISYHAASNLEELEDCMQQMFTNMGPAICDVKCWKEEVNPISKAQMRLSDGTRMAMPLEDMYPFIERDEFEAEMLVKPVKWWK
jgi:acetolactate synthase-1/2/3 large subunit